MQTCEELVAQNTRYCIELYIGYFHVLDCIYTLISAYFFSQRTSLEELNYSKMLLLKSTTEDQVIDNVFSFSSLLSPNRA